jgi:anthraniloyl-CoA monooxygenase
VRATIVGGGPAGLYLAILLKRADPANEITVLERNAPGATFGWGVVFSEETLGALRDADHSTYLEITGGFARWDTVDIRYRDRLMRSRGHAFCATSRRGLLAILQRRCHGLGVELRFEHEVTDVEDLASQTDLLVGADGVNSLVRRAFDFGATVEPQGCPYVWFGTDLVLDAFTFIFKATAHGLIQVHAYPFDEHTSTFIVEAPEPVWRRAGLDTMSEQESIAFCEALFADELDGHRLMSNRSLWTRFQRVRTRTWHRGNVVLLGDAAHTAHFSIGSGTKLAMEDAIVLANALGAHPDLDDALVAYELERQPVVDRFQAAADDSAAYFGRVERYANLEPIQFGFNLLTRSGRISHANLMLRDPEFVRVLDAWMAGGGKVAPPPAFSPFSLGSLRLPNRLAAEQDGTGAGLVISEFVAVSADGRITPETPTIADRIAEPAAPLMLRIGHAGARGATRPRAEGVDLPLREGGWPLLAASALPYSPGGPAPKEMDADDLARVTRDFAAAAAGAAEAGVAVLELDFSHGYLVAGFISPLTNRRADEYGEDRLRFGLEVLGAVRAEWGERPRAVRLSVTDWARGGVGVEEGVSIARELAAHGCDLIHVVAGQTVMNARPEYRRGFLTALSDRVRSGARVPTLVGGHLTTLDEANTIVAAARADLCILELGDSDLEPAVSAAAVPEPTAALT